MNALLRLARKAVRSACVAALGPLFALNAESVCAQSLDAILADLDKQLDRIQRMVKDPKVVESPSEQLEAEIDRHAEIARKAYEVAIRSADAFVRSKGKEGNVEDLGKFEAVITKHRDAADTIMHTLGVCRTFRLTL